MHIVFDIGNVLIRWDLHRAFADALPDPADFQDFLARSGFYALNLRADGGESFAGLARGLASADRRLLAGYPQRFEASIRDKIDGSWQILAELRAAGHKIHAITNWSAETWPAAIRLHPELAQVFDVTVVSGHEGVVKPGPAIFARLCDRAGIGPQECLFIDDAPANVAGAAAFGMAAHHFTTPAALRRDLNERGLL